MQNFTSQITFLNFRDYEAGRAFLSETLGLTPVYDIGWATVFSVAEGAYLGAVDHSRSAVTHGSAEGMLISLTTREIGQWHDRLTGKVEVSPIREIPDAGLRSFFFHGPEGYSFEIQQFTRPEAQKLF